MMDILRVALLGGVRVTRNNWRNEIKLTREIQTLLAYLILHRHRAHPREMLAGVFWAEQGQEKARRALNTALWRLRKILEPAGVPTGTYLISARDGKISFNCESHYWLDTEVFEHEATQFIDHTAQIVNKSSVRKLEKILDLYKGELLEDIYYDWAIQERERLRAMYLKGLIYLMQYYKSQRDHEKASTYGQQILNLDPIREDIHRELMRLYLECGQRALAARQYGICQLTLAKELGISPMEETQMLYAQSFLKPQISSQEPLDIEQALGQLRHISQTIELVREQVQHTLQYFAKYTNAEEKLFSASTSDKMSRKREKAL